MSSLKNRPGIAPRSKDYNLPTGPRALLSLAIRKGILKQNLILDYNNAVLTNDYEALLLYQKKVLPAVRKALKANIRIYAKWTPDNVLVKKV